jgi:hypothetical protein
MATQRKEGIGAVFWVTFVVFGLLVLIGIFIWMLRKQSPLPNTPEHRNGAVLTAPLQNAHAAFDLTAHLLTSKAP